MDLAFGKNGSLYVLEIDHDGLLGGDRLTAASSPSPEQREEAADRLPGTLTCPAA